MTIINPYLNFDGNCEEVFNFYKSVFGGDFAMVMRFKDVPAEYQMSASESEKIMHIALPIGGDTMLMGSDAPASMQPDPFGKNIHISISTTSGSFGVRIAIYPG